MEPTCLLLALTALCLIVMRRSNRRNYAGRVNRALALWVRQRYATEYAELTANPRKYAANQHYGPMGRPGTRT